jgi:endonuclease YncB( thermonuclease family)
MKKVMLLIACIFASAGVWAEDQITGKVVTVIDGNTVEVQTADQEIYKILLVGIDSPELGQEYGEQAKDYLQELLLNKSVVVQLKGKDRLGNRMGVIIVGQNDARAELVKKGLAWTLESNSNPALEGQKESARHLGKGLWSKANPTPPWEYRKKMSMSQPKTS